ncbi:hypothetical protein L1887_13893 [Cichorium endivia]|nr:hypothetical protein L1887_13893 [Cichorium endivia]
MSVSRPNSWETRRKSLAMRIDWTSRCDELDRLKTDIVFVIRDTHAGIHNAKVEYSLVAMRGCPGRDTWVSWPRRVAVLAVTHGCLGRDAWFW